MLISWLSQQLHHQSEIGESASFSKAKTYGLLEEGNDARQKSCWQHQGGKLKIALTFGISGAIAFSNPRALAQNQNIVTDGTLGTEPRLTGPIYTIPQGLGQTDSSNTNLFHSFKTSTLGTASRLFFKAIPVLEIFLRELT